MMAIVIAEKRSTDDVNDVRCNSARDWCRLVCWSQSERANGDVSILWELSTFDPVQIPNPLTAIATKLGGIQSTRPAAQPGICERGCERYFSLIQGADFLCTGLSNSKITYKNHVIFLTGGAHLRCVYATDLVRLLLVTGTCRKSGNDNGCYTRRFITTRHQTSHQP